MGQEQFSENKDADASSHRDQEVRTDPKLTSPDKPRRLGLPGLGLITQRRLLLLIRPSGKSKLRASKKKMQDLSLLLGLFPRLCK